MRATITLALIIAATLTPSGQAAQARWTPAQAAAKIKATYTTVDQKAYDYAQSRNLASAMAAALHGAKPTKVACKGSGTAAAGRFIAFRCSVTVQGSARIPPDYQLFTAVKTVRARLVGSRLVVKG